MLVSWDVNLPKWAGWHPRQLTLLFPDENVILVGLCSWKLWPLSCLVIRLLLTLLTPCMTVVWNGHQEHKSCEEAGSRGKIRVVSTLTPTQTLTPT
jgi:hypothetical protein